MLDEESQFGKGLVICLVKFAEHFMKIQSNLDLYKQMREKNPDLFTESYAITMWANGATDHLYDIETPKGEEYNDIRKKEKKLQEKGLEMGHGAGIMGRTEYTLKDVKELMDLTREIALMLDKKIGLIPQLGVN